MDIQSQVSQDQIGFPPNEITSEEMTEIKAIDIDGTWLSQVEKFSQFSELAVSTFYLKNNHEKNILSFIVHIKFPFLSTLSLLKNDIESIESIFAFNWPKISKIYLDDNRISKINGLYKVNWPQISDIGLSNNHIQNIKDLDKFKVKKLNLLQLQFYSSDIEFSPDLNWVFKLEMQNLKTLTAKCKKIERKWLRNLASNKYKNCQLNLRRKDDSYEEIYE